MSGNAEAPRWQDVAGCAVLLPAGEPPAAVLHFTGSALASAAPLPFYRGFLERLSEECSAAVVATPYVELHDLDAAAEEAEGRFNAALQELQASGCTDLAGLPVFGVGHSLGAVVTLLVGAGGHRSGSVLLAFNQQAITEALPLPSLPPLRQSSRLAEQLRTQIRGAFNNEGLKAVLQAAGAAVQAAARVIGRDGIAEAAPAVAEQAAAALPQLGVAVGGFLTGRRGLKQSRAELAERFQRADALAPRTLLVEFSDDSLDEAPWVLSTFGCEEQPAVDEDPSSLALSDALDQALDEAMEEAMLQVWAEEETAEEEDLRGMERRMEEAVQETRAGEEPSAGSRSSGTRARGPPRGGRVVERTRLQGSHYAPLDLPWEGDSAERLGRLAAAVARFVRGEPGVRWGPGLISGGRFAMREKLLRLVAGTDRGLGAAPAQRQEELLACISELEALGMRVGKVPSKGAEPSLPEALFGNWRLVWCSSPVAQLLASLPLLECGEVHQEIPRQDLEPGQAAFILTTIEVSPKGAALLRGGALPLLALLPGDATGPGLRLVLRGVATPGWGGSATVQLNGARLEPLAGAVGGSRPSVPLPMPPMELPTFTMLTSYLDEEVRVARTPFGEVAVFFREAPTAGTA